MGSADEENSAENPIEPKEAQEPRPGEPASKDNTSDESIAEKKDARGQEAPESVPSDEPASKDDTSDESIAEKGDDQSQGDPESQPPKTGPSEESRENKTEETAGLDDAVQEEGTKQDSPEEAPEKTEDIKDTGAKEGQEDAGLDPRVILQAVEKEMDAIYETNEISQAAPHETESPAGGDAVSEETSDPSEAIIPEAMRRLEGVLKEFREKRSSGH